MVPKLRFKEFNLPYQLIELNDILRNYSLGGNYSNGCNKTSKPLIKMGNLGRGYITMEKIEYIQDDEEVSDNDILKVGDLLFNTRNTLDLVGKIAIWRGELAKAYYNSNIMRMVFDNNYYMNYILNTNSSLAKLKAIASGTTSVAAIYTKDLKRIKLWIPDIHEQTKIADYLSSVYKKIMLLNRQCELLRQYKKGMMQKIFSQELKFKDDNGKEFPEWDNINAGELFKSSSNKKHNGDLPILAVTQEYGVVNRDSINIDIKSSQASINSYKKIDVGDFVISLRSFQGGIEYSPLEGICSPAYTVLKSAKPIIDDFYRFFLKKDSFIEELSQTVVGIRDGKQISYQAFATLDLPYPCLPEQSKIANFLSAIDDKITVKKTELDRLEVWKQGLLQQMFI
ncbi:EcoKI restriction-modification system protein HsdS [Serratia fonticola]|uniref:restriction endonuclease subunit S n=1 Tax=Serratia fonticola TaxID=47917 RepID=UPI00217A9E4E|nr:restriction endonuclease subunit S [Serratia fonticola]CAI1186506.1 EcoKI restriction-modification system protein HsdS [Serratia fonticola]